VLDPDLATRLKFLGDGFVLGIKFLVGPLIFTTVSLGISRANSGKNAARIGLKAFLYFELVSTFALLLGLVVGNLFQPGQGFPLIQDSLDVALVQAYTGKQGFILNPFQSGAMEFYFYAILMLGVALVFAFMASRYQDQDYLGAES
jgi:Na+/H+-dicarboxylate symporter